MNISVTIIIVSLVVNSCLPMYVPSSCIFLLLLYVRIYLEVLTSEVFGEESLPLADEGIWPREQGEVHLVSVVFFFVLLATSLNTFFCFLWSAGFSVFFITFFVTDTHRPRCEYALMSDGK